MTVTALYRSYPKRPPKVTSIRIFQNWLEWFLNLYTWGELEWWGQLWEQCAESSRADAPPEQWVVGIPLSSTPKWVSGCHCNFLRNSKEVICHSSLSLLGAKITLWWGCQFVTEQNWPETMKPRKWQLHSCHTFAQKPHISHIFS